MEEEEAESGWVGLVRCGAGWVGAVRCGAGRVGVEEE